MYRHFTKGDLGMARNTWKNLASLLIIKMQMKNKILQHLTRMSQIKTSVGTTVWSGYGKIECHTLLLTCKLMQPLQKPGRFFLFLFFLQVEQLCCDSPVPLLGICSREMKTVSKQRLGQECHSSFTQNCHTLETT